MLVLVLHSALGLRSGVHEAVRPARGRRAHRHPDEHVPAHAELLWQRATAFLAARGP